MIHRRRESSVSMLQAYAPAIARETRQKRRRACPSVQRAHRVCREGQVAPPFGQLPRENCVAIVKRDRMSSLNTIALLAAAAVLRPAVAAGDVTTLRMAAIAPEGTTWAHEIRTFSRDLEAASN